jgi:dolichol-phosphate mannosyltransferase
VIKRMRASGSCGAELSALGRVSSVKEFWSNDVQRKGPTFSIIVPTFNEAGNVWSLVEQLNVQLPDMGWEVIFVDDNSPDGTATVVREIGREHANVRCVHRIGRRGLSTACIEGMLASSAPYLAVMDCDLQHDPAVLQRMLGILMAGEVELVIGSRYVQGGDCGSFSQRRLRISRLATFLGRLLLPDDLKDPMSNFFALRRDLFDEVACGLSGLSFKILLDILLTARRKVRSCEIPIVLGERRAGESKFEIVVAWEFAMLLADKTIGRYMPVRFIPLAASGALATASYLSIFAIAQSFVGLSFALCGALAAIPSLVLNYWVSNLVTYRDRKRRGLKWLGGLVSFIASSSIGATANIALATYLFSKGVHWFVAAAAGVLLWIVWNFTATNSYVWTLGFGLSSPVRRVPKLSPR